jgi:curved DNA-binding protein CbpA
MISTIEARKILGLSLYDSFDTKAIDRAWKKHLIMIHPDKNTTRDDATEQTQLLNEARDVLRDMSKNPEEEKRRAQQDEEMACAKEREAVEARRRETESLQHAKDAEARKAEFEALYDRVQAIRRARYSVNRKKRAPGTRVHRKMDECKEGKDLLGEMKIFFKHKFIGGESVDRVYVNDILDTFVETRKMDSLEQNLFRRHAKRLFLLEFPGAKYSFHKCRRCFSHVTAKN